MPFHKTIQLHWLEFNATANFSCSKTPEQYNGGRRELKKQLHSKD
jgi:hypothetical protein